MRPSIIKVPKSEKPWVKYLNAAGDRVMYVITSKPMRDVYYIYSVNGEDGSLTRLGKSSNPGELANKYVHIQEEDK